MKIAVLCLGFLLTITVTCAQADSAIDRITEPRTLSDFEMDGITAGGILVGAGAYALAIGDDTLAITDTNTVTMNLPRSQVGFAHGRAFAYGNRFAGTGVSLMAAGEGQIVVGRGTSSTYRFPNASVSHGHASVIVRNPW